ncbi:MAG: IS110 family transposase [Slackia piriformis]|uniref:IS110 family transposase n=1 Tax=Slackia piriformis TaxID=626934 RepID=A0A943UU18_9ACTN|nr:IS110 family transposase [Slackia piriformis]
MHYVGVDIAKRTHSAAVLDDEGLLVAEPFMFENSSQGFAFFLMKLGSIGADCNECAIAMESTGHYWFALLDFLIAHGFDPIVLNPIQTDAYRKVDSVRAAKTDLVDAVLIADLIRVKRFAPWNRSDELCDALKQLTRYRSTLVGQSTRIKNKTTAALDRVFPEYADIFTHPYGPTSKAVLEQCPTPQRVMRFGIHRLTRLIETASNGRCGRDYADMLMAAARTSVGASHSSDALALQIRLMIEQLDFLESQMKSLDDEIARILDETPGRWLTTIPGVGPTLAAQITGEIGNPHRFSSARKLVAYAGMDATVRQSGESEEAGHMSKRGSAQLRYALVRAADGVRRLDPYFRDYYEKKIGEGAHYFCAVSGVARKLSGVVLALMREERAYEPWPPDAEEIPTVMKPSP